MQTIHLTTKDNGKVVNTSAEAVIVIRLEGNPTTGYRWELEDVNSGVVANVQHNIEAASPRIAGAGGSFVFLLSGLKSGSSKVALKYWKPWEGDSSILAQFEITVNVS